MTLSNINHRNRAYVPLILAILLIVGLGPFSQSVMAQDWKKLDYSDSTGAKFSVPGDWIKKPEGQQLLTKLQNISQSEDVRGILSISSTGDEKVGLLYLVFLNKDAMFSQLIARMSGNPPDSINPEEFNFGGRKAERGKVKSQDSKPVEIRYLAIRTDQATHLWLVVSDDGQADKKAEDVMPELEFSINVADFDFGNTAIDAPADPAPAADGAGSALDKDINLTTKTGVQFRVPGDYTDNPQWKNDASIKGATVELAIKAPDPHNGRIAYLFTSSPYIRIDSELAKLTGANRTSFSTGELDVDGKKAEIAQAPYAQAAEPTTLLMVVIKTKMGCHIWLMAAPNAQLDWYAANIFNPLIDTIKVGDVDFGITKAGAGPGTPACPYDKIMNRAKSRVANMGIQDPMAGEYGAGWPMTIFLLVVFLACVGFLFNEGMWGASIMLVNVIFAGIIAVNFFEPVGRMIEGWMPSAAAFADFVAIWAVFGVAVALMRVITDRVSKVKVRFLKIVDRIGGWAFAAIVGMVMMGFAGMTLHMAPVGWNGFDGGYFAAPDQPKSQFLFLSPDKMWLGFARQASGGAFCRLASEQEHKDKTYYFDPYHDSDNTSGDFVKRYEIQRYMYDAYVRQGESLGMLPRGN